MIALLRLYQLILSPALHLMAGPGYGCRHEPSCSRFAEAAIREKGAFQGAGLALRRLLSCHPFSK